MIKKIDDLGRIAIPKEIRRALRLMGGDSIEIIQENNTIILKKYQPDFVSKIEEQKTAFDEWLNDNGILPSDELEQTFAQLTKIIQEQEQKIKGG